MVTQNMLRMHEEEKDFSEKKIAIYDCPRSNQIP